MAEPIQFPEPFEPAVPELGIYGTSNTDDKVATILDIPRPQGHLPPQRLFGEYGLLAEVARGGMGVVYLARQVKLNRVVALKMILAGRLADQDDVLRFRTEAEAAGRLQHPNIVAVHEVGELEGQHFFTMEFI